MTGFLAGYTSELYQLNYINFNTHLVGYV